MLRIRLRADQHDTHADKAHDNKQHKSYAEYFLRLAQLSFGSAFRQHHSQSHRKTVRGNHEEASVERIGMRIIAHACIAYDMIHRDLKQKPDGLNQ